MLGKVTGKGMVEPEPSLGWCTSQPPSMFLKSTTSVSDPENLRPTVIEILCAFPQRTLKILELAGKKEKDKIKIIK